MISRTLSVLVVVVVCAQAQPPIQLNTILHSFTFVPATPWCAEIYSYTHPTGRDFALICRGNAGFSVYEITDPTAPVLASSVAATASDLKDVTMKGNIAYLVQQSGDVLIVSLADPYNASVVNTIPSSSGHNGKAQGNLFAYSGTSGGVQFFNISNPTAPVNVGSYGGAGFVHDAELYANGTICYAHTSTSSTHILDVSNPASPVLLGIVPYGNHSGATLTRPGGQVIHAALNESGGGHVRIYDVTNPASPVFQSAYQPPTAVGGSTHNAVTVDNRWLAIAYFHEYLRILDLTDPANPVEAGIYDPDPTNLGVGLFGGAWSVAYVRTLPGGVQRYILNNMYAPGFYVIDFTPPPPPPPPCPTGACLDLIGNSTIGSPLSLVLQSPAANEQCYVLADSDLYPNPSGFAVGTVGSTTYFVHLLLGPNLISLADPTNTFGTSLAHPNTDANGSWSLTLQVPNDPTLQGLTFYGEAFVRDFGLLPNGLFHQSNVLTVTIQ